MRIISSQEGKVSDNHQPLDMMRVVICLNFFKNSINTIHSFTSIAYIPKVPRKFFFKSEEIFCIYRLFIKRKILIHIFSPSKYLPDKSFFVIYLSIGIFYFFDNFKRGEKSKIYRG